MITARFAMGLFIVSIAAACGGGKVAPDDAGTGQASSGGQPGGSSGVGVGGSSGGSSGASSGIGVSPGTGLPTTVGSVLKTGSVDKIDLLFMIDNSAGMGDKKTLLAQAVPDMMNRLVTPNCIATDGSGTIVGTANAQGNCAAGKAAPPVPAETSIGASGQTGTLIGDFTDTISGVHEHGCGFEAQNEAWYRFLVQPDPFDDLDSAVPLARASSSP